MKKRKTREEKLRTKKRMEQVGGFSVSHSMIKKADKSIKSNNFNSESNTNHFKADLTKTLFLTMLVLALELAFWQILTRR